jgi:hypothetical protein
MQAETGIGVGRGVPGGDRLKAGRVENGHSQRLRKGEN